MDLLFGIEHFLLMVWSVSRSEFHGMDDVILIVRIMVIWIELNGVI